MSSIKFALECHLSKENGEMEFSEITIIGERDWISNAFDESMAADELKNYEQIEELLDGQYHIFVIGNTEWWVDHTMDGDEQDYMVECEHIHINAQEGSIIKHSQNDME